jgi:hypothetical protein
MRAEARRNEYFADPAKLNVDMQPIAADPLPLTPQRFKMGKP